MSILPKQQLPLQLQKLPQVLQAGEDDYGEMMMGDDDSNNGKGNSRHF